MIQSHDPEVNNSRIFLADFASVVLFRCIWEGMIVVVVTKRLTRMLIGFRIQVRFQ